MAKNKFAHVDDGYILSVQIGGGGTPITDEEYSAIIEAINNCPEAPEGYAYRLKTDLSWELYKIPPEQEPDPDAEISDSEALSIILGGES